MFSNILFVLVLLTRELRNQNNYVGRMTKQSHVDKLRKQQQKRILSKKRNYFAKHGLKHVLVLPPPCMSFEQW